MPPPVPLVSVQLGEAEERLVLEVIRSGQLAQGPMVEQLEELFRRTVGAREAVAVASGTAALEAVLDLVGVRPGDEVITSPLTFAATLNAIIASGGTARFADIAPDLTIDPASVESLLTDRTRVIMPVHLYGLPCDMPSIERLAGRVGAVIVEDAAQAIGAEVQGRRVGTFGVGCFSLYATKNVTTGEGGVVTTDDADLAEDLRVFRNQGMQSRYEYVRVGTNLRLTDLQAALGIPQMERLQEINTRRHENAGYLRQGLENVPGLTLPRVPAGRTHVFHQFTVRVGPTASLTRDELATKLAGVGIESGVYYPRLVFDYECYRSHPQVEVAPVQEARQAVREVLSLPVHQHLSEADLDTIVGAVGDFLGA